MRNQHFTFIENHVNMEIAVAFFENNNLFKSIFSSFKGMAAVELKSISTLTKIKFPLYLRLKENDKFFKYVEENRAMSVKQKENLLKNDVEDKHIKVKSIEEYKKYFIENYFKEEDLKDISLSDGKNDSKKKKAS